MTSGQVVPVGGVFQAIERPHRLAFTWGWEGDAARQSLITLTFRDLGPGRTELTLLQQGLGTRASRDDHERGWTSALGKLARYVSEAKA
jgi:uncharacterized protein YndB with AHSA1/START domain